ncbi:MAG TPA: Gfo/Idh/MocA family oxidoreductase, partial [Candidatus Brachybacterium merdigallinarum]|nr:Gfo/Idh/MocA family oxidoreductase [Candidatus Brachybacterium merdigallinarum]
MSTPFTGPVGVGFIGAGVISDQYLTNLTSFPDVKVLILGDLDTERAAAQAEKYGVPASGTAQDVLDHPDVQVVVNLTIPAVHAEISSQAIAAGKHVWTEKPLGLDRESTSALLREADAAGLRVGCAPDTVLGAGVQTAKRAILDGLIG